MNIFMLVCPDVSEAEISEKSHAPSRDFKFVVAVSLGGLGLSTTQGQSGQTVGPLVSGEIGFRTSRKFAIGLGYRSGFTMGSHYRSGFTVVSLQQIAPFVEWTVGDYSTRRLVAGLDAGYTMVENVNIIGLPFFYAKGSLQSGHVAGKISHVWDLSEVFSLGLQARLAFILRGTAKLVTPYNGLLSSHVTDILTGDISVSTAFHF